MRDRETFFAGHGEIGFEPRPCLCNYSAMRQISVIELQSDVVAWIRQAVIEKQIVITDQGQPIAALIPFLHATPTNPVPNREERIGKRTFISTDSAIYISEMRD